MTITMMILTSHAACQGGTESPLVPEGLLDTDADAVSINTEHFVTDDDGVRRGVLSADTVLYWDDFFHASFRNVELTVVSAAGDPGTSITGEQGSRDGRLIVVRRNAVLTLPGNDRRIESPEVYYDSNGNRAWSDSAFVFYDGSQTIRGPSFELNLNNGDLRIGITGAVRP